MSNDVTIKSSFKNYDVAFVDNFAELFEFAKKDNSFFVIDNNVYKLYSNSLPKFDEQRLFVLNADENEKNVDTVLKICEQMTVMPTKRNTHLISIGGGITQDITGLVANILYRGVRWTFYPTTLLAACDSCIGGKSSLNYKGFKNLLGSFYPPDNIYICPTVFKTLTQRDYYSGLGEVVKFNVIAGETGIAKIERDIDALCEHDYNILVQYVKNSLLFKKKFIEVDEFDKGERVLLNFAHTFGHAYESVSDYAIPHGSAVVLGMITANNISVQRGYIEDARASSIENICKKILTEIEIDYDWFSIENVINAIRKDKKQTSTEITAVLLTSERDLSVVKGIQTNEIESAVKHLLQIVA